MQRDNAYIYILGLVGVVAIVGILAIVTNTRMMGQTYLGEAYLRETLPRERSLYEILSSYPLVNGGNIVLSCSDTDGFSPFRIGSISYIYLTNTTNGTYRNESVTRNETCVNNTILIEYACVNGQPMVYYIECRYSCGSGACISDIIRAPREPLDIHLRPKPMK